MVMYMYMSSLKGAYPTCKLAYARTFMPIQYSFFIPDIRGCIIKAGIDSQSGLEASSAGEVTAT